MRRLFVVCILLVLPALACYNGPRAYEARPVAAFIPRWWSLGPYQTKLQLYSHPIDSVFQKDTLWNLHGSVEIMPDQTHVSDSAHMSLTDILIDSIVIKYGNKLGSTWRSNSRQEASELQKNELKPKVVQLEFPASSIESANRHMLESRIYFRLRDIANSRADSLDSVADWLFPYLSADTISWSVANYPNPFCECAKVDYVLPDSGAVIILLYDVRGRVVDTLANSIQFPGYHSVNIPSGRLVSGIYFYKLTTKDGSIVKKIMILK